MKPQKEVDSHGEWLQLEILRALSEQTPWNFHVCIFIQAQNPKIILYIT